MGCDVGLWCGEKEENIHCKERIERVLWSTERTEKEWVKKKHQMAINIPFAVNRAMWSFEVI